MRLTLVSIAAAAFAAISAPAAAGGQDQKKTESAEEAKAEKEERKICRRIAASESRLAAKRVCMTASEWRKQQDR